VAVFFTVTKKNQGGSQIAGMIIAAKASSDHVEAAVLTDDAARFSKTINPMTRALFKVWHPLAAGGGTASGKGAVASAPAAPLHLAKLPDASAAISIPDGWQIDSRRSGGGTILAQGPNGESAEMGMEFLASDPSYPAVQQTLQQLQRGQLRNTSYANASYISYRDDLAKSFVFQIQKIRKTAGLPEARYTFTSQTPVGQSAQDRCAHLEGTVDFSDGKGLREVNILYCAYAPNRFGGWASLLYSTTVPLSLAPKERATLGAIMQSFQVDQAVVARMANQYAKPEIDKIHEIGRVSAEQARQAHIQEDIHNSSVYEHWDSMDKRSQEFENYQLDYAVISNTDHTAHGTFDANEAALLVQQNPDKLEYVSAPNYWKGIDY
jgi:hypothetical protein